MNLIKPKTLKNGDTIGILATSGNLEDNDRLCVQRAVKYLENKGFKVVLSDNVFDKHLYLAGSDDERVRALHEFFLSDEIAAILCLRGGYGALKLVDKIDFRLVKAHPKIFAGYSDVSILNALFLKHSNLMTFYSPMALGDFGAENVSDFSAKNFFDALEQKPLSFMGKKTYFEGTSNGIIFGGNLATVASMAGLDFLPDNDFIFFAEDLHEPVYKIDRCFTQLLGLKNFRKHLKGIILGDFLFVDDEKLLTSYFEELAVKLQVPFASGFAITHAQDKLTLPYGASATLSASKNPIVTIS